MSKVVVLKLSTGEEVIGKVSGENHEELFLEFALGLNYQMQDEGKLGFAFFPYGPLVDKNKNFRKAHVVWQAPPLDGLLNAYNQATSQIMTPSDKIITPPKSLIIG